MHLNAASQHFWIQRLVCPPVHRGDKVNLNAHLQPKDDLVMQFGCGAPIKPREAMHEEFADWTHEFCNSFTILYSTMYL